MNLRAFGIGVSAVLTSCAPSTEDVASSSSSMSQAIINGAACGPDVEPTAMAVLYASFDDDVVEPECTGTLIAPDVVLLAAHCVLVRGRPSIEDGAFYVTFESDLSRYVVETESPLPAPERAVRAHASVAHPDYAYSNLGEGTDGVESDIALLFLEEPITSVRPEVVITADEATQLREGADVQIAGWGFRSETMDAGFYGVKQCGATSIDALGESLMQIGADPAAIRKCFGDSGGPTYMEIETSSTIKRRVIGATSRNYNGRGCALGAVDSRVDYFLPFIDEAMRSGCATGERVWCDVDGILPASFLEQYEVTDDVDEDDAVDEDVGCTGVPAGSTFAFAAVLKRRRRR